MQEDCHPDLRVRVVAPKTFCKSRIVTSSKSWMEKGIAHTQTQSPWRFRSAHVAKVGVTLGSTPCSE